MYWTSKIPIKHMLLNYFPWRSSLLLRFVLLRLSKSHKIFSHFQPLHPLRKTFLCWRLLIHTHNWNTRSFRALILLIAHTNKQFNIWLFLFHCNLFFLSSTICCVKNTSATRVLRQGFLFFSANTHTHTHIHMFTSDPPILIHTNTHMHDNQPINPFSFHFLRWISF